MQPIYVIKVFTNESEDFPYLTGEESVGFFHTKEKAIEVIENNIHDIYEGTAKYVVVLTIYEGIYETCAPEDEIWFIWSKELEKYTRCIRPIGATFWSYAL